MEEKTDNLLDIIFKVISGLIGSLVIGYLFFQLRIFNFHNIFFSFVTGGIYGAVFFSLLQKFDFKKQLLILVAVVFINIIIMGKPYYFSFMLRDFVLIIVIFLSIKAYTSFITKNKNLPLFIRAFALPVIYAVINIGGVLVLVLISELVESYNLSYLPGLLLINAEIAGLVGLGLGLGFDTWEFIKTKFLKEKLIKPV